MTWMDTLRNIATSVMQTVSRFGRQPQAPPAQTQTVQPVQIQPQQEQPAIPTQPNETPVMEVAQGTIVSVSTTKNISDQPLPANAVLVGNKPVYMTGGTPEQQASLVTQPAVLVNAVEDHKMRGVLLINDSLTTLGTWIESRFNVADNCTFAEFMVEMKNHGVKLSKNEYRDTDMKSQAYNWWTGWKSVV